MYPSFLHASSVTHCQEVQLFNQRLQKSLSAHHDFAWTAFEMGGFFVEEKKRAEVYSNKKN